MLLCKEKKALKSTIVRYKFTIMTNKMPILLNGACYTPCKNNISVIYNSIIKYFNYIYLKYG